MSFRRSGCGCPIQFPSRLCARTKSNSANLDSCARRRFVVAARETTRWQASWQARNGASQCCPGRWDGRSCCASRFEAAVSSALLQRRSLLPTDEAAKKAAAKRRLQSEMIPPVWLHLSGPFCASLQSSAYVQLVVVVVVVVGKPLLLQLSITKPMAM